MDNKNYYINECRSWALNSFNKKDRYQEYIQLYKEILNKK